MNYILKYKYYFLIIYILIFFFKIFCVLNVKMRKYFKLVIIMYNIHDKRGTLEQNYRLDEDLQ